MLTTYTITITNKNSSTTSPQDNSDQDVELIVISPIGIITPGISYEEYLSDNTVSGNGKISVPLYKRNQNFILKPSSILTIITQDSDEAAYYMNLQLDSVVVEVESDESLVTESLKNLYVALGGNPSDVEDANSTLDVLNALSFKYGGEDNAESVSDAIDNITAVAGNIGGGGLTVKTTIFHTKVPEANPGLVAIRDSDFPEDYVGGFHPLRIYLDYNVQTDLNWTNPIYLYNGGEPGFYIRASDSTGFVYDASKNVAVGLKVAIHYEYLANEK